MSFLLDDMSLTDITQLEEVVLAYNKASMDLLKEENFSGCLEGLKKAEDALSKFIEKDSVKYLKLLGITENNLGCYYKKQNKPKIALNYLQKALRLEEIATYDEVYIASTHLNICVIDSALGKHEEALLHGKKAFNLLLNKFDGLENEVASIRGHKKRESEIVEFKEQEDNLVTILTIAYHNIAAELEFLNRYDEAIKYFSEGILFCQKNPSNNSVLAEKMKSALDDLLQRKKSQDKLRIQYNSKIMKNPLYPYGKDFKAPLISKTPSPYFIKDAKSNSSLSPLKTRINSIQQIEQKNSLGTILELKNGASKKSKGFTFLEKGRDNSNTYLDKLPQVNNSYLGRGTDPTKEASAIRTHSQFHLYKQAQRELNFQTPNRIHKANPMRNDERKNFSVSPFKAQYSIKRNNYNSVANYYSQTKDTKTERNLSNPRANSILRLNHKNDSRPIFPIDRNEIDIEPSFQASSNKNTFSNSKNISFNNFTNARPSLKPESYESRFKQLKGRKATLAIDGGQHQINAILFNPPETKLKPPEIRGRMPIPKKNFNYQIRSGLYRETLNPIQTKNYSTVPHSYEASNEFSPIERHKQMLNQLSAKGNPQHEIYNSNNEPAGQPIFNLNINPQIQISSTKNKNYGILGSENAEKFKPQIRNKNLGIINRKMEGSMKLQSIHDSNKSIHGKQEFQANNTLEGLRKNLYTFQSKLNHLKNIQFNNNQDERQSSINQIKAIKESLGNERKVYKFRPGNLDPKNQAFNTYDNNSGGALHEMSNSYYDQSQFNIQKTTEKSISSRNSKAMMERIPLKEELLKKDHDQTNSIAKMYIKLLEKELLNKKAIAVQSQLSEYYSLNSASPSLKNHKDKTRNNDSLVRNSNSELFLFDLSENYSSTKIRYSYSSLNRTYESEDRMPQHSQTQAQSPRNIKNDYQDTYIKVKKNETPSKKEISLRQINKIRARALQKKGYLPHDPHLIKYKYYSLFNKSILRVLDNLKAQKISIQRMVKRELHSLYEGLISK